MKRFVFVLVAGVLSICLNLEATAQTAPCENGDCFAVFVMPDTQNYTYRLYNNPYELEVGQSEIRADFEDEASIHLKRTAEWVCANRLAYAEPATGESMPIELVIHLGDMVQRNDLSDPGRNNELYHLSPGWTGPPDACANNHCEWVRISRAFDAYDDCPSGPIRYLTAPGNHDWDWVTAGYSGALSGSVSYAANFSEQLRTPWLGANRCTGTDATNDCDGLAGQWYIGGGGNVTPESTGGNLIPANGRVEPIGAPDCSSPNQCGPPLASAGRHRVGIVEAPSGGPRFLFAGLEWQSGLPYSHQWVDNLLHENRGLATVLFNHEGGGLIDRVTSGPGDFKTQVVLLLQGHAKQVVDNELNVNLPGGPSYQLPKLTRDYNFNGNGVKGWNTMLVVDPSRNEIRVASLRLDGARDTCDPVSDPATCTQYCQQVHGTIPGACDSVANRKIGDIPSVDVSTPVPDPTDPNDPALALIASYTVEMPSHLSRLDADVDGVQDSSDNCPLLPNPLQTDKKFDPATLAIVEPGDGVGDACQNVSDADADFVPDQFDNCLTDKNAFQSDTDGDGFGNYCDADLDNTGLMTGTDFGFFIGAWQSSPGDPNYNPNADMVKPDGNDGPINGTDWVVFSLRLLNGIIGPSGLHCADDPTNPGSCAFGPGNDYDGDGFDDDVDNCNVIANPFQRDTDGDGFGNLCDADLDNSGLMTGTDFGWFVQSFGKSPGDPGYSPHADMYSPNGLDGPVNITDYGYFLPRFLSGLIGPSGLPCAGAPCPITP